MPGFLAAIPLIGQALDSLFGGIDKITTTDEERLKFKTEMWSIFAPVVTLLVQAQAAFDKAQADIKIAEIQSADWFVRRSRPAMMWVTFIAWQAFSYLGHPQTQNAFYAFGLVAGLWSASRGGEKIMDKWISGKNGNGNGK